MEDLEEQYRHHIHEAERNAQKALDILYKNGGPPRSLWVRMAVGRAQSILMSVYIQEMRRKR